MSSSSYSVTVDHCNISIGIVYDYVFDIPAPKKRRKRLAIRPKKKAQIDQVKQNLENLTAELTELVSDPDVEDVIPKNDLDDNIENMQQVDEIVLHISPDTFRYMFNMHIFLSTLSHIQKTQTPNVVVLQGLKLEDLPISLQNISQPICLENNSGVKESHRERINALLKGNNIKI